MRARGRLAEAEKEALEAIRQLETCLPRWTALGHAELGEIRRRRGDLEGAMEAFRLAASGGWEPVPGLALCLADSGDPDAAYRSVERVFRSQLPTPLRQDRSNLLLARAALAVRVGEQGVAIEAVEELEALAEREARAWDTASAALARGWLEIARGDAAAAVDALLVARCAWSEVDAPYELALTCEALGRALVDDGDRAGARLAHEAALQVFERIGAHRDRARIEELLGRLSPDGVESQAPPAPQEVVLRRDGDIWALEHGDRVVRLRHSVGLQYLARLLEEPGAELAAVALVAGRSAAPGVVSSLARASEAELMDDRARAETRRRVAELEEELDEARRHNDLGRCEALEEEKLALLRALAAAVGLGGRGRRTPGVAERARQSVTKALRGAVQRIGQESAPLGRHLRACLRTGAVCAYQPDPDRPIVWRIRS